MSSGDKASFVLPRVFYCEYPAVETTSSGDCTVTPSFVNVTEEFDLVHSFQTDIRLTGKSGT